MLRQLTKLTNQLRCPLSPVSSSSIHTSAFLRKTDKTNKFTFNAEHHIARREKEKQEQVLKSRHEAMFDVFIEKQSSDKQTFINAVDVYLKREGVQRRGQVEFIYAAMKRMEDFNVHRDLSAYKKLFTIFPEKKMVAQNLWQVELMHYPKQQYCGIDLLDKMSTLGVIPDDEFGYMILRTFGKGTHVMRKYQRMMYWMPKFANINPWPIPKHLPEDPTELACVALRRMAVDLENTISVWHSEELEETASDQTWITSAQSPHQISLLGDHDPQLPVYIDGGYHVWVRYKSLTHFVLRSDAKTGKWHGRDVADDNPDDIDFKAFYEDESAHQALIEAPSVHEQEDGTVLAMAITGTSSIDSLRSWIRLLQRSNPHLADLRVVFRLRTPELGLQAVDETTSQALKTTKA